MGGGPPLHIAFVSGSYPSSWQAYSGVFLQELIRAMQRRGIVCTPIHPIQLDRWLRHMAWGGQTTKRVEPDDPQCPVYLAASSRAVGAINTMTITQAMFQRAALHVTKRLRPKPDAVYGHFLYPGGGAAAWCGRKMAIPSFVAVGESVSSINSPLWSINGIGSERARRDLKQVSGVIAVSSLLKRKLVQDLEVPAGKIGVFPNGVDRRVFVPYDRREMRQRFALPEDRFLVVFVGSFDNRKGAARVGEAVEGLEGVVAVFVGSGPQGPTGSQQVVLGVRPHAEIPRILSAADVFVLPTTAEGSCNGLVEAMACGLPIITSIGEFNSDLVDDAISIRVDPLDVRALRQAIMALRDDHERRRAMAQVALERSEQFDIDLRAERISAFVASRM